jgi:hypothetical protein
MVGIEKIKIDFPIQSLNLMMKYLIKKVSWGFALDYHEKSNKEKEMSIDSWTEKFIYGQEKDKGFSFLSYDQVKKVNNDDFLNNYALIIFEAIKQKSQILKSKNIIRFFWNFYHPLSTSTFHVDCDNFKTTSIIFNPHTNTGGTEFIINGKNEFVKSEINEAIVFSSTILHRGISPKKESSRFSLNMMVE